MNPLAVRILVALIAAMSFALGSCVGLIIAHRRRS